MTSDDVLNRPNTKQKLRDLDGLIPENTNRRSFFKTAVGSIVFSSFAGCIGAGGNGIGSTTQGSNDRSSRDDNTNQGSGKRINRNVVWRTAFAATPNYAPDYAADLQGFWADQNIAPPNVKAGSGSGDTVRRVGTGTESFGEASIIPQVSSYADMNFKIFGTAKARTYFVFIYRTDQMASLEDIGGKTIAVPTITELIWDQFLEAIDAPNNVNARITDIPTANALVTEGDVAGIMETTNGYGSLQASTDIELGIEPVYNYTPIYGYTTMVNANFLGKKNNLEYTARILSGYSHALKWTMLNPEAAVDMMVEEVNSALQTNSRKSLLNEIRGGVVAPNLADDILQKGLGHLSTTRLQKTFDTLASGIQGVSPPSADDAAELRPQESAELATLSPDEERQVREFAKPYPGFFE